MRALRKAIVIALIALAIAPILSLLTIDRYYFDSRPERPDPRSGRIYPERLKGAPHEENRTVYLTRAERLPYAYASWMQAGGMLFAFTAYILNRRWKVIWNPREDISRVTPSKPASALGALVGGVFIVVGICVSIYIFRTNVPWFAKGFAVLWTLIAAGVCIYHCVSLRKDGYRGRV